MRTRRCVGRTATSDWVCVVTLLTAVGMTAYATALSGQNVTREGNQLSQLYSMAQAQMQADAQVRTAQAQGAATKEAALERSRTKMAELYLRYPTAEVQRMVATGVDPEGNPISPENLAVLTGRLQSMQSASPFEQWLASQGPAVRTGQ